MFRTAAFLLLIAAALATARAATAQQFSRGNALVNESAYAVNMERWRDAVNLAEEALRSGEVTLENVPAVYNNLCIGLTGMRRFEEAIAACNKAVDMKPRQWSFYNNRANIYFYLGQFSKALAEYYKAVTFNPANRILLSNINLTLEYRKSRAEKSS
jgi:tetratricopeptide (TPR) repeat protein